MAQNNETFRIETLSWNGQYGNGLTNTNREIGRQLATCHVLGVKDLKNLQHNQFNVLPAFNFKGSIKSRLSYGEKLRLDCQGYTYGNELIGCQGLTKDDKFARYEIQKDGETGKTAIAHVCLPVNAVIEGEMFVNAFAQSMTAHGQPQKRAIIRKE